MKKRINFNEMLLFKIFWILNTNVTHTRQILQKMKYFKGYAFSYLHQKSTCIYNLYRTCIVFKSMTT